jgi:putative transposase
MRNLLADIAKGNRAMVEAALRTVFTQPDCPFVRQQLAAVVQAMRPRWLKAAELLEGADKDILAFMDFPIEHWSRIVSTNPSGMLNKKIKRLTNVVSNREMTRGE